MLSRRNVCVCGKGEEQEFIFPYFLPPSSFSGMGVVDRLCFK
jgi:hypothetical protein